MSCLPDASALCLDGATYRNPQGTAFPPIQDTSALAVCDGG